MLTEIWPSRDGNVVVDLLSYLYCVSYSEKYIPCNQISQQCDKCILEIIS